MAVKTIHCALVHDHVLLRQGLRRLLEDAPDMQVVAEAGEAAEALQSISAHHPDVVIADADVFELAEDQVEGLIHQTSPRTKILFLTMYEDEGPRLSQEQSRGAKCAVQRTSAQELVEAVRDIHYAGNTADELPQKTRNEWPMDGLTPRPRTLTAREHEVLKLLAEGKTVRSAADVLGLSIKTVDAHKFNLMRKLGVHNKAELVMWAIQKKVVKLPASY